MSEQKYIEDIREIKEIMNRSSRFLSLSGMSGVFAGIFALIGAYAAYQIVYYNQDYLGFRRAVLTLDNLLLLLVVATITLVLSVGVAIYLSAREARKKDQKLWDHTTRRLLINFSIPLFAGGILCLILLFKGYIGIVAPLTLIFYGLALVNASSYTLNEIRSLGIIQVILGLLAVQFIGYGLIFWSLGFGLMHIIYGVAMHFRYKS